MWAVYGFLPIIWIPAGVAAFHALRHVREGRARIAMLFAVLAAISMMVGLWRWPAGLIGMFRNVTAAVAVVASINNYLLPAWMIVFGGGLLRAGSRSRATPTGADTRA